MHVKDYDPATIKAIQAAVGAREDGAWGPSTVKAISSWRANHNTASLTYSGWCRYWEAPDEDEPLPEAPVQPLGTPRPVHLGMKGHRGRDGARAFGLGADLGGEGRSRLYSLPGWLDVEHSIRYKPKQGRTYCNIYATDFARACGLYLPRVWWRKPEGVTPETQVQYGETVSELSANGLFRWLRDWAVKYGWQVRASKPLEADPPSSWLQDAVDTGGRLGIICAHRKGRGSGHITVVLPQREGVAGWQAVPGAPLAPLQSQAGTFNRELFSDRWWMRERFSSVIFAYGEVGR